MTGDRMKIANLIWLEPIVEKIESKHGVETWEVEEALLGNPEFRRGPKGRRVGENVYYAFGRTAAGRYLFVVFILKRRSNALILSAREMTEREKNGYRRRRRNG